MNTFRNKWATSHTSFPLRTFKVQHKRNYSVNLPEIKANHVTLGPRGTNAQTRLELIMITLDYIIDHETIWFWLDRDDLDNVKTYLVCTSVVNFTGLSANSSSKVLINYKRAWS